MILRAITRPLVALFFSLLLLVAAPLGAHTATVLADPSHSTSTSDGARGAAAVAQTVH